MFLQVWSWLSSAVNLGYSGCRRFFFKSPQLPEKISLNVLELMSWKKKTKNKKQKTTQPATLCFSDHYGRIDLSFLSTAYVHSLYDIQIDSKHSEAIGSITTNSRMLIYTKVG